MNLISCNNCGVVLDGDKLNFDYGFYTDDYEIDDSKAMWCGKSDSFKPFVKCPCCSEPVLAA